MSSRVAHTLERMPTRWFLVTSVVQYSMPRTGSTLIRRILYQVFPECEQPSQHPPGQFSNLDTLIISCRHPLDVLVSLARIGGASEIDGSTLDHYLPPLEWQYRQYAHDMSKFKGYKLKLKYEKFWNNYDYVFDQLEEFVSNISRFKSHKHVETSKEKRTNKEKICGIKNTKKIQRTLKGFNDVDEKTRVHGNHIATPEPFNYKKILTDTQIAFLEERLHEPLEEWRQL